MAANEVRQIPIPAEVSSQIISNAIDATGLANLVSIQYTSSSADRQFYDFTFDDAKFHNPVTADKTVGNDSVAMVNVPMFDIYKIIKVQDFTPDQIPGVIAQIQRDLGRKLGETLQKSIFPGVVDGSPWGDGGENGAFDPATAVDTTTVDGWLSLTSVKGYSGMLLNQDVRADLRTALTSGNTTTNALTYPLTDGSTVDGKPVYFVDLGDKASTDVAGIAGDWSKAVLFVKNDITMSSVDSSTSYQMMLEDAVAYKVKWRVGFAVADKSRFKVFKKAPKA